MRNQTIKMRDELKGHEIIHKLTLESKLLASMDKCDAGLLLDWLGGVINGRNDNGMATFVVHKLAARGGVIQGDYGQDD